MYERNADLVFTEKAPALSGSALLFIAIASGLAVANIYFAQPLLDTMGRTFGIAQSNIGMIITITQIFYALGLFFLVPLGDLLNQRRLAVGMLSISVVALLTVGIAPSVIVVMIGMAFIGLFAVVAQVLVAYTASLAAPEDRGRAVGLVTSGIVIGILLARTIAGLLTDLAGWRSVYYFSAVLTMLMAAAIYGKLPRHAATQRGMAYPQLLRSVWQLFVQEPLLRVRAVLALFIFTVFSILWTSLVLPLSAPPLSLSHSAIGSFGLAGVAGALAAVRAGKLADRGLGQRTTGIALVLLLLAWVPLSFTERSLWALMIGVIVLDFAVQAVHVTNQSMILSLRPESRSRLTAGYMIFYSIGSAIGSISSTVAYSHAGWTGVCLLGASVSAAGLLFWSVTRHIGFSISKRSIV